MGLLDDKYQISPNRSSENSDKDATDFIDRQGTRAGDAITTGMTQKTADRVKSTLSGEGQTASISFNKDYPISDRDAALIIASYERDSTNINSEEAALVTYYKDVYSTRNFSQRVQEQMNYYPGLHNPSGVSSSEENPFVTNAEREGQKRLDKWDNALDNPESFMNTLRSSVPTDENGNQAFDYSSIFGSKTSAKDKAQEIGKMLSACIPCFDRILDMNGLVPDGDLLEVHGLNIKLRIDILDKILDLFKNPGMFVDICELLKLLSGLCPQDLIALMALLTQYLAKLNLDFRINLDFIINLVGPILSPFLDALSQWLDKWVQLILGPVICITDHINETIYMLNTTKLAVQNASVDIDGELNLNVLGTTGFNGIGSSINSGASNAENKVWGEGEAYRFDMPPDTKYKEFRPNRADLKEEVNASWDESLYSIDKAAGSATPSEKLEAEEREKQFQELNEESKEQYYNLRKLPGTDRDIRSDGSRWSDDGTPLSEKKSIGSFSKGVQAHPPEKQSKVENGIEYFDPSPLVSSIVQLRNIVQAGVRYIQDWFNYVVQMVYDLLGVDFGWLLKKNDTSFIKSRILQLILMIKSLLEAIAKNGLKCGVHNNFDPPQMKFILENGLNKFSTYRFTVKDNGDISVVPPSGIEVPSVDDVISEINKQKSDEEAKANKNTEETEITTQVRQKTKESGIIIKNCLRDMTQEEVNEARQWISDYERRLEQNA